MYRLGHEYCDNINEANNFERTANEKGEYMPVDERGLWMGLGCFFNSGESVKDQSNNLLVLKKKSSLTLRLLPSSSLMLVWPGFRSTY